MAKIKHTDYTTLPSPIEKHLSTRLICADLHEVVGGGEIVVTHPPSGFHKVYEIYAEKVGNNYQLRLVVESEPEP